MTVPSDTSDALVGQAAYLRSAMDAQGLDGSERDLAVDNDERAMIAAICMGESHMFGHSETGYAHTSNDRIRCVFGSRVEGLSDPRLDALKADDRAWFDYIYSPRNSTGKMLGNTQEDDGYLFRGRGFIQLTGRSNFAKYGELCGHPEIVQDPDRANEPEIAAALAVAYIDDRWDGADFASMLRCVGNNTPDIRAAKEGFYEQFKASGEYDFQPAAKPKRKDRAAPGSAASSEPVPSIIEEIIEKVEQLGQAAEQILSAEQIL